VDQMAAITIEYDKITDTKQKIILELDEGFS